jgi:hypothetical protein
MLTNDNIGSVIGVLIKGCINTVILIPSLPYLCKNAHKHKEYLIDEMKLRSNTQSSPQEVGKCIVPPFAPYYLCNALLQFVSSIYLYLQCITAKLFICRLIFGGVIWLMTKFTGRKTSSQCH